MYLNWINLGNSSGSFYVSIADNCISAENCISVENYSLQASLNEVGSLMQDGWLQANHSACLFLRTELFVNFSKIKCKISAKYSAHAASVVYQKAIKIRTQLLTSNAN